MNRDSERQRGKMKIGYVYIMTNKMNKVLYVGVTSDLIKRAFQHRNKMDPTRSFCYRYNLTKLVYYEFSDNIASAIWREKQIKGGSRAKKIELINTKNPKWEDLYKTII